ncbi:MAG: hypothetical protein SFY81_04755 [Verrucomicrobiota bacterium]|nr:hypothetical protein [Verrucomicrobiota bacterium]
MNEVELIEKQMKEWRLREPSKRLANRLFSGPVESPSRWGMGGLSHWLLPAMGCFLLAVSSLNTRQPMIGEARDATNRAMVEFAGASFHTAQNSVPVTTLEWTIGNGSPSSRNSFLGFVTNTIIH